jgi:hypothetical protein
MLQNIPSSMIEGLKNEHGAVGGMKTGKRNQVLEKNLASVPLCSSQLTTTKSCVVLC